MSKVQTFRKLTGRTPRRVRPFSHPVEKRQVVVPVESMPHYWYPRRAGVVHAPEDFQARTQEISDTLWVCKPPESSPCKSAWAVWMQKPSITYPLSPGWLLLFIWESATGEVLPLDNRVFANLYLISRGRWGSARKYFDHCLETQKAEKAAKDKVYTNERRDMQKDFRNSFKISTAGQGNKFARHHDGSIIPSKGQADWHREQRRSWIPSSVRREEDERRERLRSLGE